MTNVTFPTVYGKFLNLVAVVNLDLTWVMSLGCYVNTNFYDRLLVITLLPLLVLSLLVTTFWVAGLKHGHNEEHMTEIRRKHLSVLILVTFLVYSSASSTIFQTFACDHLDDDNWYLRADYRLRCHRGGNTVGTHLAFTVYAGFMVFVYPLGIPAFYAVLLCRSWRGRQPRVTMEPRSLSRSSVVGGPVETFWDERSTRILRVGPREHDSTVRELWKPYKHERSYYEVVECLRRVVLTGVVVFIFPDSAAQVSTTFLLALIFFAVSEVLSPYESLQDCWISRFGHLVVLLSMFVALLLKVDVSDESETGQDAYSIVLVVANVAMLLAIVGESLVSVYSYSRVTDGDGSGTQQYR